MDTSGNKNKQQKRPKFSDQQVPGTCSYPPRLTDTHPQLKRLGRCVQQGVQRQRVKPAFGHDEKWDPPKT